MLATAGDHHHRQAILVQSSDNGIQKALALQRSGDGAPSFVPAGLCKFVRAGSQREKWSIVCHVETKTECRVHKPELTRTPLAIAQTLCIKSATDQLEPGGFSGSAGCVLVDGQQSAGGLPSVREAVSRSKRNAQAKAAPSVVREPLLSALAMVGGISYQRRDYGHASAMQSARHRASTSAASVTNQFVRYRTLQTTIDGAKSPSHALYLHRP